MSTAQEVLDRHRKVDLDLCRQVAIELTAADATAQQRQQLSQGLKMDESYLPDYSPRSVKQYGKPPGPIKLYDTGAFYRGILIDVRGDIFIMESADPKSTMLQNRYGKDILGLGARARAAYIVTLRPIFYTQVLNYYHK